MKFIFPKIKRPLLTLAAVAVLADVLVAAGIIYFHNAKSGEIVKTITVTPKLLSQQEIENIPENEFISNYSLKSAFKDLSIGIKTDKPALALNSNKKPGNFFQNTLAGLSDIITRKKPDSGDFQFQKTIKIKNPGSQNSSTVQTSADLSGIKISTGYEFKKEVDLNRKGKPVKQTITIQNSNSQDINLKLEMKHVINSDSVKWNSDEYKITETPQTFKSYLGKAEINPADYDITPEQLGVKQLPTYTLDNIKKGTSLSFKTQDGEVATYDWSDMSEEINPEVSVVKENGQYLMIVGVSVNIPANSSYVVDPEYVLSNSGNYTARYDGAVAGDNLGFSVAVSDVNGNSKGDLIIGAYSADNNTRIGSGSVYIIFSTTLDDQSGNINLSTGTNYNIRYDGAVAGDALGFSVVAGDVNGDTYGDLIMGANGASSGYGAVYVNFSTLVDDYLPTTTGNNVDLATSTNYNIHFSGDAADALGISVAAGDVDGDSKGDLVMGTDANTVYFYSSTVIDNYSGTNNNVTASASSSITYTGINLGYGSNDSFGTALAVGDLNGDGYGDLVIGSSASYHNSRTDSGSVYVVLSNRVAGQTGTVWLSTCDPVGFPNCDYRFDGGSGDYLGSSLAVGDINGAGNNELIVGAYGASYNSRSGSGSVYVLNPNIDTGDYDLSVSDNYNIRYDGAAAGDNLGISVAAGDVDGDTKGDLIMGAYKTDYGLLYNYNFGSVYVNIFSLVDNYLGAGNTVDLSTSTNYSIRYDGAFEYDNLGISVAAGDVDGDTKGDLIMGAYLTDNNTRTNSGSVYFITSNEVNLAPTPSTISVSPQGVNVGSSVTFTGTWTEPNGGDLVKMYICKDSACTNCNNTSQTNCWCYSSAYQTEPDVSDTCTYTALTADIGNRNFWLSVCDDQPSCSATALFGGSFTVGPNSNPILSIVGGGILWLKGLASVIIR